jgi:acyl transferase domain-containing protein/NADP-dependent 3-hydroxy acid dehydrogenase YdfG
VPIAIVSIGALFPGAPTTEAFWRDIVEGRDRLTEVPRTHWLARDHFDPAPGTPDKVYTTRGGFLSDVDFSPMEFGLPPSTIPATDTCQLLGLVVAKRVLAEATRGRWESMDRSRISVLLGVASATELCAHMAGRLQIPVVEAAMRAAGIPDDDSRRVRAALEACYVPWQENTFPGLLGNVVAGRIANRFDLGGTNAVLDAACAGSLAALDMAVQELSLGIADLVITGGVDTLNDILMFMCFAQTGALSRSGDCRPFSKDADGTMLGEGIGLFALRRLADAERDGDPIYAVIRGVGASSDGRETSIYAPLAAGQVRALERAYVQAGVSASTVGLVEAHGTGTVAGDATELAALREVYERAGASPKQTAIGSVKGQIGHTKAAAGAAGLAKAALALHHKVFPPTIKVGAPLPALADSSCPFYASTSVRPWIASGPRRAAVSALGFGGTNFHVVLEEHVGPTPRPQRLRALPAELVLLGAPDAAALAARCRDEAARLGDPGALVHLAKRSQLAFDAASPLRLALVAASEEALADLLRRAADALESGRAFAVRGCSFGEGAAAGPVALLFPGQGSQSVGMGSDLAVHFDDARAVWDEAAALDVFAEEGLHDRVFPPPALSDEERDAQAERLKATAWAQPALSCASLAMLRLCRRVGLSPVAVGGHSLGEITALAAGGALDTLDAIRLARTRGTLMEAASRGAEGAMIAVTADGARIEALLARYRLPVTLANYNSPRQLVISGERAAIETLTARLGEEGVAVQRLAVATAFHSPLVERACAPLRRALEEVALAPAVVPVYSNVTAAPYPADPGAMRDQLASAVALPVRFVEQVEAMYAAGARTFVEVGPGRVLTQLVGRCLEGRPHIAVALERPGENGVTAFFHALGQLAVAGVALDFASLWEDQVLPADPASRPAMKHVVRLNGANFGKPYPAAAEQALAHARPPSTRVTMSEPPKPPPPPPETADLLTAVREMQAPLIAAQMEYEKVMAESHAAFLRAVEASYAALSGSLGVPLAPVASIAPVTPIARVAASPVAPPPAIPSPPAVMHAPPPAAQSNGSGHVHVRGPEPVRPRVEPAKPVLSTLAELLPLVRSVVAEKTGYPIEMIDPTMDLASDLGIDSIKRVEILSALRARAPGLPTIEPAQLGKLRTLAEIVRFLEAGSHEPSRTSASATPTPAPETRRRAEIARFVVESKPSPAIGLAAPGLFGDGVLAVIPDDQGIAALVCAKLNDHGIRAEASALVPPDARGIVFLSGLSTAATLDDALRIERDAFEAARVLARRAKEGGKLFVTVQDTGGDLGLSGSSGDRAWLAGLAALTKTAAEEWPGSCARAIDIDRGGRDPKQIADAIVHELLMGGSEREVGLAADGARCTLVGTPRPHLAKGKPVLGEGDVVVVSGGARGVTAACAIALAAAIKPRLVLIGRTALVSEPARFQGVVGDAELKRAALEAAQASGTSTAPRDIAREVERVLAVREVRATLARLTALGIEARYDALDVRDAGALGSLLAEVRAAWGPVRGLVHGAGVLADALLENRSDATQFDRVFDTKVRGLAALLGATATDPLAWICLFSSAAARAGNAGQADYAMANEILNKVAAAEARRRGEGTRVVSIGWGPWDGGMVTPALARHFESRGIGLIPLEEGAAAFVREADGLANGALEGPSSAEVVLGSAHLATPASRRGEVWIDSVTAPHLEDHRVRGTVVLPVVQAIEWFARIAAPGPFSLHDVHVRRGVLLPAYGREGERAEIVATPASDGVSLELKDASGGVRIVARAGAASAHVPPAPLGAGGIARDGALNGPLYGPDRLFHGPQFQVLDELHALSPEGGHASVKGTLDRGWSGGPWRTDAAAIDGALQLALLSSLAAGMGPTLPLRIAEVSASEPPSSGPIACVVEMRSRTAERAIFDAWLTGPRGEPVASLRGIEMFLAPSGT